MEESRILPGISRRQSSMTISRATVREFDDNHLVQQIKTADVLHSESPADFERWQMVGLTSMPLKQEQNQQQGQGQQSSGDTAQGDWNHSQPKGKAAEAVMLYVGGARSHPIGMVDDRRVRPYALKEGETALYAASGTGQMLFHNDDGSYLVATNNPPEQSQDNKDKERFSSLRHVKKQKQSRTIQQGSTPQDPKHQGETVNTEIRTTSKDIQILDGSTVVAKYDKASGEWTFTSKKITLTASDTMTIKAANHLILRCDGGKTEIWGKPVEVNGGGTSIPPFTVPG